MSWRSRRPVARWRRRAMVPAELDYLTDKQLPGWAREHGAWLSGGADAVAELAGAGVTTMLPAGPEPQPDREAGE